MISQNHLSIPLKISVEIDLTNRGDEAGFPVEGQKQNVPY